MAAKLQFLFFLFVVKPLILIVLGLNVRHRQRLPSAGPAIIVANHNSHLDTLVLMSLFPAALRWRVRPVAAADYFLKNRWLAWFSQAIFHIIPIERTGLAAIESFLEKSKAALDNGEILLLYPEGTRGEPEHLSKFKSGITTLVRARNEVPVLPIFTHGLGKSLPRGDALLVPFFCDAVIGQPVKWTGNKESYLELLEHTMQELAAELEPPQWE